MLPRIIAFAGPAGAGKDAVAAQFPSHKRIAFADELKRRAAIALGTTVDELNRRKGEFRDALVAIGAGARRIDPFVWVKPVEAAIARYPRCWAVTDVRYENEARMIQRHGGCVVYVNRPGITFANSEEAATLPLVQAIADTTINNDSDPVAVAARVRSFLESAA